MNAFFGLSACLSSVRYETVTDFLIMKHIYSTTEQKTRHNRSFPDDGIKMLNMDLNTRFNINKIAESKFGYRT